MSKYYKVSEESEEAFMEVFNKKSFPGDVKFQFIGYEKQKSLIKISKLPDQYVYLLDKELLVTLNEELFSAFDEESITILIEQEIDKVSIDISTGKIKLVKTDLNTFTSLINKYGVSKVARANQVEELYTQQKEDQGEFIV